VQKYVKRIAVKMHEIFEKLNLIHRDVVFFRLSLVTPLVWTSLCL